MTQPVTPTPEDREAAASAYYAWIASNPVVPEKMRSGLADDHSMVQAFARHAAAAREEAEADIALWKREAEDRSQGMIELNLDRASQGVEISQLREIVRRYGDRIAMANAPAYLQHAIDDALAQPLPASAEDRG